MSQNFQAGDFLVFQIESGYGLLRVLGIDETADGDRVFHLAAYSDLYFDVETADAAIESGQPLAVQIPHAALTTRAFEATQTARMSNRPLSEAEIAPLSSWDGEVSDRSIRLLLGLR